MLQSGKIDIPSHTLGPEKVVLINLKYILEVSVMLNMYDKSLNLHLVPYKVSVILSVIQKMCFILVFCHIRNFNSSFFILSCFV